MDWFVAGVFGFVYLGMVLGRVPGLALDRTGVATLGAMALIAGGAVGSAEAWAAVDMPTMALLFALMVVSAQFRLGGFYTRVTRRLAAARVSPPGLLALVVAAAAGLSALLANDIVCLAMTPILLEGCARRGLDPVPFLLALACAANVGSAATLIGNPQNMLIGQVAGLGFAAYLRDALPPVALGLAATWAVIAARYRGRWERKITMPDIEAPAFDLWQSGKGMAVLAGLVLAFLFGPWPREAPALAAAGLLLLSRRMTSRRMFALVDWQLLLLFLGLFVVNHALAASGELAAAMDLLARAGMDLGRPATLFAATVVLSNLVSNVPAVMLLASANASPQAGLVLALASTLAGNLFLLGSIANLIVADSAGRLGVEIGWRTHLRVGLPVTLATCAIAGGWLWLAWDGLAVAQ
ncbi:MAG: SLC13 family permease [Thermodesulfobacteriota bacterium]